jgi:hypothetical protein
MQETERGSPTLQSVDNSLWKRLWTCHETDYRMMTVCSILMIWKLVIHCVQFGSANVTKLGATTNEQNNFDTHGTVHRRLLSRNTNKMQLCNRIYCSKVFLKAQHVSSGTPLIIRSSKLYLQPLVYVCVTYTLYMLE